MQGSQTLRPASYGGSSTLQLQGLADRRWVGRLGPGRAQVGVHSAFGFFPRATISRGFPVLGFGMGGAGAGLELQVC